MPHKIKGVYYRVHKFILSRDSSYWRGYMRDTAITQALPVEDAGGDELDALLNILYTPYVPNKCVPLMLL